MQLTRFNIRVYGVLVNNQNEVLLVHEKMPDTSFTKFPGGGLELGEGIKDCLKREFKEETGLIIEVGQHLYTTDFFQQSAFRKTDQLISIYYYVHAANTDTIRLDEHEIVQHGRVENLRFFWVSKATLNPSMLTFPIDQLVCGLIQ